MSQTKIEITRMGPGDMQVDPGPWALYQSVFPDRYPRWNVGEQLWEIWVSDENGDDLIEKVFQWSVEPDQGEFTPFTPEQEEVLALRQRIQKGQEPPTRLQKVFMAIDYPFVRERLQQKQQFEELGVARYNDMVQDKNRAIEKSRMRTLVSESAAAIAEKRRMLPVLNGDTPIPQVPGGLTLER